LIVGLRRKDNNMGFKKNKEDEKVEDMGKKEAIVFGEGSIGVLTKLFLPIKIIKRKGLIANPNKFKG
jgi:hypothetical protein